MVRITGFLSADFFPFSPSKYVLKPPRPRLADLSRGSEAKRFLIISSESHCPGYQKKVAGSPVGTDGLLYCQGGKLCCEKASKPWLFT